MLNNLKIFLFFIFINIIYINFSAKSEIIKKIDVTGNERISTETIILFSEINTMKILMKKK